MKTLDEVIQEERVKENLKEREISKMEETIKTQNRQTDKFQDQRYKDVRQQSQHDGWWDGAAKYQFVNRNVQSMLQRDTFFLVVQAICKNLGPGIGIGGTPIPGILEVNIGEHAEVQVVDEKLPFEDNSIGYIVSSHTLEHIPNTEAVLNEWIRVLKPNGLIAITMPDKRYFQHDNGPHISKYDYAYCEMEPDDLKINLNKFSDRLELLLFDTNQNNFDMNALLRKRG